MNRATVGIIIGVCSLAGLQLARATVTDDGVKHPTALMNQKPERKTKLPKQVVAPLARELAAAIVFASHRGVPTPGPTVESQPVGVGTSIIRYARIPVAAKITDNDGVKSVWLEYRAIQKGGDPTKLKWKRWDIRPRTAKPKAGAWPKVVTLPDRAAGKPAAIKFDVLKVRVAGRKDQHLLPGDRLQIRICAEDADVSGPHRGCSRILEFRILSLEKLAVQQSEKEHALGMDFERVIEDVENQTKVLRSGRLTRDAIARVRASHRRNREMTKETETAFRQLVAEIRNNRMPFDTTRYQRDMIRVLAGTTQAAKKNAPKGSFARLDALLAARKPGSGRNRSRVRTADRASQGRRR